MKALLLFRIEDRLQQTTSEKESVDSYGFPDQLLRGMILHFNRFNHRTP
jgi:hypothetical protein